MATTVKGERLRGYGSKDRPLLGDLWRRDSKGFNEALSASGNHDPDYRQVDYRRYYDPAVFQAELDHIWRRQWLFACREEDIPEIGDRVPLDVGPHSYFVVRTGPESFKAFYNSCLHRGTKLCAKRENAETVRCPYHAWEWNIDGRLKRIPSHWDFPELTRVNGSLPEVKLDRWAGFIFINADQDARPLSDALGILPDHFREYAPERRYTKARFRKLVHANWKTVQEAFMESYHLYATHPEAVPFTGDSQSQYDVFLTATGAIAREAVPSAVPSMHAEAGATILEAAIAAAQGQQAWHYPDAPAPAFDEQGDARAQIARWVRDAYAQAYGRPTEQTDAALIDSTLYFMYPHFTLWLAEGVPLSYQFLPHEHDPDYCYFDVRLLMPWREGDPRPPAAPAIEIGPNESIAEKAPAFQFLGYIFDQDMSNLPLVQQGLKAANPAAAHSRLGAYQESIIQAWHELFDRDLSG